MHVTFYLQALGLMQTETTQLYAYIKRLNERQ